MEYPNKEASPYRVIFLVNDGLNETLFQKEPCTNTIFNN